MWTNYAQEETGIQRSDECETCVREKENSLGFYIANSAENLMRGVGVAETINADDIVASGELKKQQPQELKKNWCEKKMHEQFIRKMPEKVDQDKNLQWSSKNDLKIETKALLYAAYEQAIRTNCVNHYINKTSEIPLCRLCRKKGESVQHLVSRCEKLAQNNIRNSTAMQQRKAIGMFEQVKVFWDTNVHCDNAVEARRSDIIVIDKKEQKKITINIAVPADVSVGEQERDKVEMYLDLKREREREREREIRRLWKLKIL